MTSTRHLLAVLALILGVVLGVVPPSAPAQEPADVTAPISDTAPPSNTPAPSASEIQNIINSFAAKEAEFKRARDNYTYHQSIKVQELDDDGAPMDRQYVVESDIVFSPGGTRTERVTYAPLNTLRRLSLTPEDERDFRNLVAFILTTEDLPKYNVRYQGRQHIDELDTYVFRVSPKTIEKGERYFDGVIWVDDRDYQIVKSYGKAVPDKLSGPNQNRAARFETYREQIDGKYWFPTWSGANESLPGPNPVRFRVVVKYDNYKQFKSDTNITYGDEVDTPPVKQ
jgi:hypothetical protein